MDSIAAHPGAAARPQAGPHEPVYIKSQRRRGLWHLLPSAFSCLHNKVSTGTTKALWFLVSSGQVLSYCRRLGSRVSLPCRGSWVCNTMESGREVIDALHAHANSVAETAKDLRKDFSLDASAASSSSRPSVRGQPLPSMARGPVAADISEVTCTSHSRFHPPAQQPTRLSSA